MNAVKALEDATLEAEWHLLHLLVDERLLLAPVDFLLYDTVLLKEV